jgi:CDP-diacylglycerol--glycerol-3-phosphate 3-phosphatidyltransferase
VRTRLYWLPNALSLFRLALVPAFVLVAVRLGATAAAGLDPARLRGTAIGLLLLSGATDVVDGHLARRWRVTTRFGAIADALADKATQISGLVVLTMVGAPAFPSLPLWLVGSVLLRDLVLGSGWVVLPWLGREVDVAHEFHGKVATVFVFVVLFGATVGTARDLLFPVIVVAAVASLISATGYTLRAVRAPRRIAT